MFFTVILGYYLSLFGEFATPLSSKKKLGINEEDSSCPNAEILFFFVYRPNMYS